MEGVNITVVSPEVNVGAEIEVVSWIDELERIDWVYPEEGVDVMVPYLLQSAVLMVKAVLGYNRNVELRFDQTDWLDGDAGRLMVGWARLI